MILKQLIDYFLFKKIYYGMRCQNDLITTYSVGTLPKYVNNSLTFEYAFIDFLGIQKYVIVKISIDYLHPGLILMNLQR